MRCVGASLHNCRRCVLRAPPQQAGLQSLPAVLQSLPAGSEPAEIRQSCCDAPEPTVLQRGCFRASRREQVDATKKANGHGMARTNDYGIPVGDDMFRGVTVALRVISAILSSEARTL